MLSEVFTYLTTPCDPHVRSMGYLRELIATEARHRRCRAAWSPHLDRTKTVIRDAVHATEGRKKAIVLGAGILCDIPVQFLADHFESVVMVDVCFLRQTRRRHRRLSNVTWRTCDLTGIAGPVSKGGIPKPPFPFMVDLSDADLVISANVLSQLPLVPIGVLRRLKPSIGEDTLAGLGAEMVRHHLAHLRIATGTVCMITEVERLSIDANRSTSAEDPLFGVAADIDGSEWFWDLAPKGEISPHIQVRNRVRGGLLLP